jgi:hypothetical protein
VKIDAKTGGVVLAILAMCCSGCAVAFTPASVSESTPDSGSEAAPPARAESGVDSGAEAKAGLGDAMVALVDAGNAEASAPDFGAPDPLRGPVRCLVTANVVYVCNDGGTSYVDAVSIQSGQDINWVTFGDAGGVGVCHNTDQGGTLTSCPIGAQCFVGSQTIGSGVTGVCE